MNSTRRRLLRPAGLPNHSRRKGWQGTVASIAVHALLVALLLSPAVHSGFSGTPAVGGGGPGDPGGGGGGGGARALRSAGDRLQFVTIRPAPAPPPEAVAAVPDASQVSPPERQPARSARPAHGPGRVAIATGEGEGSGGGAGAGAGPGTGGGVGSGIGTGRGSGVGPGTGGGPGETIRPRLPSSSCHPFRHLNGSSHIT
jgi:periplasmic protein TonB